jgi:hypothetical protein
MVLFGLARSVKSIRDELVDEYKEYGGGVDPNEFVSDRLHEMIDGHQWIIYYGYNTEVLKHTNNEDAYIDNFGEWPADKGLNDLQMLAAFEAMRQDVSDEIDWDAFEEDEDEDED